MNSDVVQSVLHLSSACADEARTPQLRAAGQITGVRPGMTDVLGERQRVQGARAPRWSGASALLRPLADLQLPPPSVGKRRHGVTGVLQADPARVTGSNAITWPVTRLTGTSSVTAEVTAPVILLCTNKHKKHAQVSVWVPWGVPHADRLSRASKTFSRSPAGVGGELYGRIAFKVSACCASIRS